MCGVSHELYPDALVLITFPPQFTHPQLVAGDELDANWRPPAGYDGTPNESSADVLTRMTQVRTHHTWCRARQLCTGCGTGQGVCYMKGGA